MKNKHFHRENDLFALIQTFKMFLEYLFTDLTFFVIQLNFTKNICNLVRNHGDETALIYKSS